MITQGKEIISGHRRWLAAKEAGLRSVPVRYSEFDNELAEREALIEFNRQREKTPGQIVNEYEEMRDIEEERGKENMSQGGSGERVRNVSKPLEERAAEKVGADVSGRTLEKGRKVKDKAELVENWNRDDPRLAPQEKETTIRFARDEDRAVIHTDEAGE